MTRLMNTTLLMLLAGAFLASHEAAAQDAPPPEPTPLCGPRKLALISDFEDGEAASPEAWAGLYFFNDGTGVQTPADPFEFVVEGGPGKSRFMAHTLGDGFVDWGGGIGVHLGCGYDVGKFQGIRFAVQAGGAGGFRFEVPTLATSPEEFGGECIEGCNDHYGVDISLPEEDWYECSVRFQDLAQGGWGGVPLPLDLTSVTGVQYVFGVEDMPFDLSLDEISFERKVRATGCVPIKDDLACGGKKHSHAHKRGPRRR